MQHEIWIRACYDVLYQNDQPILIEVPDGVGALAQKGRFLPTLHLVGAEDLAEPIEMVAASEQGAAQLVDRLLELGRPIRFGHHPIGTIFSDALFEKASKHGFLFWKTVPGSPYIELDDTWREPTDLFNSRRRSDFRRMRRRAEQEGEITFEFHEPAPSEVPQLLKIAIDVESKSWKARSRTALADNESQRKFFATYGRLAASAGILRINLMKIGSETVAMQLAAECDDGYWLFKIGYDERYARCSPGMLMMLESIRKAASNNLRTFEFLGKSAEWTRFWTKSERPNCSLRYYPRNPLGLLTLGRDAVQMGSRRTVEKLEGAITSMRKRES